MYTFAIAERPISYEKIKQIQVNKELGRLVIFDRNSSRKEMPIEEEKVLVFESKSGYAIFMFYDTLGGKHPIIEFMEQLFDTKIYYDLDFLREKEFEIIRKQYYNEDILKLDMTCEDSKLSIYVSSETFYIEIGISTTFKRLGYLNRNFLV